MSDAKFTKGKWAAGRADMATIVDGYKSKRAYTGDKYCAVASGSDIDGKTKAIVIVEGFATGVTVNRMTGYMVYCAFNTGNLA